jgi:hypothetical protein
MVWQQDHHLAFMQQIRRFGCELIDMAVMLELESVWASVRRAGTFNNCMETCWQGLVRVPPVGGSRLG